jgi:hypothetical protein
VIFTASQNLSNASVLQNDENLLEITGGPRPAKIYLAEFMRLYDRFKTRIMYERSVARSAKMAAEKTGKSRPIRRIAAKARDLHQEFTLAPNGSWQNKWFKKGSPEYKTRRALTGEAPSENLRMAAEALDERPYDAPNMQEPAEGDVMFEQ